MILDGNAKKGDVLGAARIAGIMAAKKTHELIPLCHPLLLTKVSVDIEPDAALPGLRVTALARVTGKTGVEMEALTAASVACLTIYDMAKAVDRGMVISGIRLVEKTGGKSGDYRAAKAEPWRCCRSTRRCERLLADAEPLAAETRAAGRGRRPRAGRAADGAADAAALPRFGDGRLCGARRRRRAGAGAADGDRHGGRPDSGSPARSAGRGGAHLHRRAGARGRRHDRHPGECASARRRRRSRCSRRSPPAATSGAPGSISRKATRCSPTGRVLDAAALSLAASANHPRLPVVGKPLVAIIATGDELLPPGSAPGPDQIIASNAYGVAAIAQAAGARVLDLGIAPDRIEAISALVRQGARRRGRRDRDAGRRLGRRPRPRARRC